jgi:hypothetical protein
MLTRRATLVLIIEIPTKGIITYLETQGWKKLTNPSQRSKKCPSMVKCDFDFIGKGLHKGGGW